MQIISRIFLLTFILIFVFCCGEQQSEQEKKEHKAAAKFVLNDGKKWQMDEHTRNAIKELDSLLNTQEVIKSIEEYNQFGQKLDDELILLIRGCTMEGSAHDQLHIFLGYFYPQVQSIKKETTIESAEKLLNEMQSLFEEYHKYFE